MICSLRCRQKFRAKFIATHTLTWRKHGLVVLETFAGHQNHLTAAGRLADDYVDRRTTLLNPTIRLRSETRLVSTNPAFWLARDHVKEECYPATRRKRGY